MESLHYFNKTGKRIELKAWRHAYSRFAERYKIVHGQALDRNKIVSEFTKTFNQSDRVTKLKQGDKRRQKKYGNDNLFFRTTHFTFIVQNAEIVTVEISSKGKRHFNKIHLQI